MDDEGYSLGELTVPEGNPTQIGFPPTLPLELAARNGSIKAICANYGISKDRYQELCHNDVFLQACADAKRYIEQEGGSFKAKIKTMAEALLPRMFELATTRDLAIVPAATQASLIQSTIRMAGLDASIDQKGVATAKTEAARPAAVIQINFR